MAVLALAIVVKVLSIKAFKLTKGMCATLSLWHNVRVIGNVVFASLMSIVFYIAAFKSKGNIGKIKSYVNLFCCDCEPKRS